MEKAGNKEARPEQIRLNKLLIKSFWMDEVRMEYPVYSGGVPIAVIDIANVDKRLAYRIMGESHSSDDFGDNLQRERLEKLGWKVIDIWKDINEWLWE